MNKKIEPENFDDKYTKRFLISEIERQDRDGLFCNASFHNKSFALTCAKWFSSAAGLLIVAFVAFTLLKGRHAM